MTGSYVLSWEDEPPEHPVIAELRAQPGRWAILRDRESHPACIDHPNVETKADVDCDGADVAKARWVPDPMASRRPDPQARRIQRWLTRTQQPKETK